jgi:hypothetical protein
MILDLYNKKVYIPRGEFVIVEVGVINVATVASLSVLWVAMYSAPVQCFTRRTKLMVELSISLNRNHFFSETLRLIISYF